MAKARHGYQRLLQLRLRRVHMGALRLKAGNCSKRVRSGRLRTEQQEDDGRLQHDDDGRYGHARRW